MEENNHAQNNQNIEHTPYVDTGGGAYLDNSIVSNTGGVNTFGPFQGNIYQSIQMPQIRELTCPEPPKIPIIGGRNNEIEDLKQKLVTESQVLVSSINGNGGIGKTNLAKKIANDLFFDKGTDLCYRAVLWVDVNQKPNEIDLLLKLIRQVEARFEYSDGESLSQLQQRVKAALKTAIETKCRTCKTNRVLVVFDDVWDDGVEVVKKVKEIIPHFSTVLTTSRSLKVGTRLGVNLANSVSLSYLDAEAGAELLKVYLSGMSQDLLEELSASLGGYPLALKLAAFRLQIEPNPSDEISKHIRQYRTELPNGTPFANLELEYSEDKEESISKTLQYSYLELGEALQERFRALGIIAYDQSFDLQLLAAIWNVTLDQANEIYKQLWRLALLELAPKLNNADESDDYQIHPVLQSYALGLLKGSPDEYSQIKTRYQKFITNKISELLKPPALNLAEVTRLWPHILKVGNDLKSSLPGASVELLKDAQKFAGTIRQYLAVRRELGHLDWLEMGLEASKSLSDKKYEALFLNDIGAYYKSKGENYQALEHFLEAHKLHEELNDLRGKATTYNNLGGIYSAFGKNTEAKSSYENALTFSQQVGDREGEATVYNNIGKMLSDQGNIEEALENYKLALEIFVEINYKGGEAFCHNNIGRILQQQGFKEDARTLFLQAQDIFNDLGDIGNVVATLNNLGGLYEEEGHIEEAKKIYLEGLDLIRLVGDITGEGHLLNNLGNISMKLKDFSTAKTRFEEALQLFEANNEKFGIAMTKSNLGQYYCTTGDFEQGIPLVEDALNGLRELESPRVEEVEGTLEILRQEIQNVDTLISNTISNKKQGGENAKEWNEKLYAWLEECQQKDDENCTFLIKTLITFMDNKIIDLSEPRKYSIQLRKLLEDSPEV